MLDRLFGMTDLEPTEHQIFSVEEVPTDVISLRALVHLENTGQGFRQCNCWAKCQMKCCSCLKHGSKCKSHCRKGVSCKNGAATP